MALPLRDAAPADPDELEAQPLHQQLALYLPLIVVLGIVASALAYLMGMELLGMPIRNWSGASLLSAFRSSDTPTVVLYAPRATRTFFQSVGGDHERILRPWRQYLTESRRGYREINDPSLLKTLDDEIIVLPSAVALSATEIDALAAHQKRGGAILASGAFGARDEAGHWLGWQAMSRLFGTHVVSEIPPVAGPRLLRIGNSAPGVQYLDEGSRIPLDPAPEPVLGLQGKHPAASVDAAPGMPGNGSTLIAYGETTGGRWIVWGIPESVWTSQPSAMKQLSGGALDWLQRRPMAFVTQPAAAPLHNPVKVAITPYGQRLDLEISNTGQALVKDGAVTLFLPRSGTLRLIPSKAGTPAARVVPLDVYRTRVVIDALQPGHYAYHLAFE